MAKPKRVVIGDWALRQLFQGEIVVFCNGAVEVCLDDIGFDKMRENLDVVEGLSSGFKQVGRGQSTPDADST